MKLFKSSNLVAFSALGILLGLVPTRSEASPSGDTVAPKKLSAKVECDLLSAVATLSLPDEEGSRRAQRTVLPSSIIGLDPMAIIEPKCNMAATEKGGHFFCACADGESKGGAIGPEQAQELHGGGGDALINWCLEEVARACGPFPEEFDSGCESPQGECGGLVMGRVGNKEYTDVMQECACADGRHWFSLSRARSGFKLSKEALDSSCKAQLARCGAGEAPRFGEDAIEIPGDIPKDESMVSCGDATGLCQTESIMGGRFEEVLCKCEADESERSRWFGETVLSNGSSVASRSKRCSQFLSRCAEGAEPKKPEPGEPEGEQPEPGEPEGGQPKADKPEEGQPKANEPDAGKPGVQEPKPQQPGPAAPVDPAAGDSPEEGEEIIDAQFRGCSLAKSATQGSPSVLFAAFGLLILIRRRLR